MTFPLNCWYLAAWETELPPGGHVARTIAGKPLLLFRDDNGEVSALLDRCPHRFAPLSRGQIDGGQVACGYHGIAFDLKGNCVRNPHGPIVAALKASSFPAELKHKGVWVWLGEAEKADPALIADFSIVEEVQEKTQSFGMTPVAANYLLCADNILDLTHGDYLHLDTVGGGAVSRAPQRVREENGEIYINWDVVNEPAIPLMEGTLPESGKPVDMHLAVRWTAPGTMWLNFGAVLHDKPELGGPDNWALHVMTPRDEKSTYYFWWLGRNMRIDDAEFHRVNYETAVRVFTTEDVPMLEAQQATIGDADFDALRPVLVKTDEPAVRARRRVKRMIDEERKMPELASR
jgi:vanillate O-demethylase monooxygenase subunit